MASRGRCVCGYEDTPARVLKHYRSCEEYAIMFQTDSEAAARSPEEVYAAAHPAPEPSTEASVRLEGVSPSRAKVSRPKPHTIASIAPGPVLVEQWSWTPTMLEEISTSEGNLLTDH